jgi:hypothetical protein
MTETKITTSRITVFKGLLFSVSDTSGCWHETTALDCTKHHVQPTLQQLLQHHVSLVNMAVATTCSFHQHKISCLPHTQREPTREVTMNDFLVNIDSESSLSSFFSSIISATYITIITNFSNQSIDTHHIHHIIIPYYCSLNANNHHRTSNCSVMAPLAPNTGQLADMLYNTRLTIMYRSPHRPLPRLTSCKWSQHKFPTMAKVCPRSRHNIFQPQTACYYESSFQRKLLRTRCRDSRAICGHFAIPSKSDHLTGWTYVASSTKSRLAIAQDELRSLRSVCAIQLRLRLDNDLAGLAVESIHHFGKQSNKETKSQPLDGLRFLSFVWTCHVCRSHSLVRRLSNQERRQLTEGEDGKNNCVGREEESPWGRGGAGPSSQSC